MRHLKMAEDPRQYCHPHVIMTRNGWAPYAGDLRKRRAGTIAALLAARKAALEAGDAEQASAAGDAIDAIYNAAVGDEAVGLGAAFKAAKVLADSIDAGRMTLATNDADADAEVPEQAPLATNDADAEVPDAEVPETALATNDAEAEVPETALATNDAEAEVPETVLATNDADADVPEHLETPDKVERPKKFPRRMASQIFGGDLDVDATVPMSRYAMEYFQLSEEERQKEWARRRTEG